MNKSFQKVFEKLKRAALKQQTAHEVYMKPGQVNEFNSTKHCTRTFMLQARQKKLKLLQNRIECKSASLTVRIANIQQILTACDVYLSPRLYK